MIDETILDKVCPVPSEEKCMEDIAERLEDKGFVINNFNKGGIFYTLARILIFVYLDIKTLGRTMINNLYTSHAEGDWLEIKAADYSKVRNEAVKTRGYITIHREDYENPLQVIRGHAFKTPPDQNGKELKYYVLEDTVIAAGDASGKVLVEAEHTGVKYNVLPGKINISMIHLEGVSSVENEDGWLQREGTEMEDLENLRARCKGAWSELAELTTDAKIKNVAMGVNGVLDVQIDSQHPRGQGTADIIVTGVNGTASQQLLDDVEAATSYLRGNYDDFLYKSSSIYTVDLSLILYLDKNADTTGVKERAEEIIYDAMQLVKREEKNCFYMDDLRYALKTAIKNYKRAIFITPTEDLELKNDQVIVLGKIDITVRNVGG